MSWVTSVILIFGVAEEFDEDENHIDNIEALDNINSWLEQIHEGQLIDIGAHAGGGNCISSSVYGGAFKLLDINGFIQKVKEQPWQEPENVQILIQDDDESRFTLHTIAEE